MRSHLIQAAQTALRHMHKRDDRLSRWACQLKERKGNAIAVVARANKRAGIFWSMIASHTWYRAQIG